MRRVKICLTFMCLGVATAIPAQAQKKTESDKPIHAAFTAKAGDTFTLKIKRRRQQSRPGRPKIDASSTANYDGKILEKTANGYVIEWVGRKLTLGQSEEKAGAKLPQELMNDAFLNQKLVFEADETGRPVRMRNWKSLVTKATDVLSSITPKIDSRITDRTKRMMLAMTDQQAAAVFLKEAHLIASLQVMRYAPETPTLKTVTVPNPLGGSPIKTNYVGEIVKSDEGDVVIAQWTQRFDPKSTRESITALFQALAARAPAERRQQMLDQMKTFNIDRIDRVNGTIGKADGWVRKASARTDIVTKQGSQVATRRDEVELSVTRK